MASSLLGAWEMEADNYSGLVLFSENHYSILGATSNRAFENDPPTDADIAKAFKGLTAFGGTYSVSGDTVTVQRTVARDPSTIGEGAEFELIEDGDTVSLKYKSGLMGASVRGQAPFTLKLRKVS